MPGTVFNSTSFGVDLYNPTLQNPATIASAATITNIYSVNNGDAVYGDSSVAWTVYNFGTAEGTQGGAAGVRLASGGDVHNASTGRIAGDAYGVAILGSAGTITNYGTIEGTGAGSSNAGVFLDDGSIVRNGASGYTALISGYDYAVRIAGVGTVTNYGTIAGSGAAGHGVYLYGGGYVINQASGLISGGSGIGVGIAAGTVNNYGTITGQDGLGVELLDGGAVSNQLGGLITGYVAGIRVDGAAGSVVNFATIGSGTGGGIYLQAGGNVTNLSTGRIDAYVNGIFINGGSGTVVNFGTIETTLAGGGGVGIFLASSSGVVINEATGAILAASGLAIDIGPDGTVVNYGTIANADGNAVRLQVGGTLVSGAGGAGTALIVGYDGVRIYGPNAALTNYGTIASNGSGFGAQGVDFLFGGALSNQGTILGINTYASGINAGGPNDLIINGAPSNGTALIAGWLNGIDQFSGTGTVVNYGTVSSSNGDAVYFQAGGSVANYGLISGYRIGINSGNASAAVSNTGVITGQFGIDISGGVGAVGNSGTIVATRSGSNPALGVALRNGGSVGNTGLIQATGAIGVYIGNGAGSLVNSGTIVSYYNAGYNYFGVYLQAGGNLTNQAGGLIAGAAGGVAIAGGGTATNYGTIAGDYAVALTGAASVVSNSGTIAGGTQGVRLTAGGLVTNNSAGVITGYFAVDTFGGLGTIVNYGTIQDANSSGAAVFLQSGGSVLNGLTGTIGGPIYGNAIRIDTGSGALVNLGLIFSAAAGTNTVYFTAGGTVTNSGLISGGNDVVKIRVDGLVSNFATIAAAGGTGIWLPDGGTVVNNGLVTGTDDVIFTGYTAGTVINYGTVINTGAYGDGVCLDAGGLVFNAGLITGPTDGVNVQNGLGNVVNTSTGTIAGGGVFLRAGGTVSNAAGGLIEGAIQGIAVSYGTGSVLNYGTIAGTGVNSGGVYLTAGGTVTNASTGIISGTTDGIDIGNATGVVLNYGTIFATNAYSTGVWLIAGGSVTNAAYGYIQGFDGVVTGSYLGTGVGTVVNDGSIAGANLGVWLAAGGTVVNSTAITASFGDGVVTGSYGGLGVVLNSGTIVGPTIGVWLQSGGSIVNTGTIAGPGAYGDGVRISGGGTGFVHNYNLISGSNTGIYAASPTYLINLGTVAATGAFGDGLRLNSYPGTVFNVGTILGTQRGLYLGGGGSVSNQLGGRIIGGSGVAIDGGAGSLVNLGTIAGTSATGVGIFMGQGGSVANGNASVTTALISGASHGVFVYGAPTAVVNYGTIAASISYASGVKLVDGGTVDNKSSGVIQGGGVGVLLYGGAGTVTNAGAIAGGTSAGVLLEAGGVIANGLTTAASITGGDGIALLNVGGTIVNGSGSSTAALIDGYTYGILARDGASAIANYGTIIGTIGAGVDLQAGGFVANASGAVIASGNTGVRVLNAAGALSNAGTVQGGNLGVYLAAGGSIVNQLAGTISGADGVRVIYGAGTVTNFGTISATGISGFGVQLSLGGNLVNGAATATGASIVGTLRGVSIYNTGGYVNNFGTIAATVTYAVGVYLHAGGGLTNQLGGLIRGGGDGVFVFGGPGTVMNLGSIDGLTDTGVVMASGGLLVNGPGGATSATISGGFAGVQLQGQPATIVNYGTIIDPGFAGVAAIAGATISNSRLITGYQYGVGVNGGVGIITNSGEISATGTGGNGIHLLAGGALLGANAIANYGTIAGGSNGVFFVYDTNITNYGLIAGATLAGVNGFSGVGVVTNLGTIGGGAIGVQLAGGSTLFNAGTITGGSLSVYLTGGNSRVAIDPSAVFIGNIDAHLGGADVIELAPGTGIFGGFNSTFIGFEQIAVDAGGDWQISGPVIFGAGFILTDAGALDFDNDLNNDGTLNIETGAVLSFTGTVGGSGVIDFNGGNGTLVIGNPSAMTNSIVDFAPTDVIDFVGIGQAASYSYGGGVLRLMNGGGTQIAQAYLTTTVTNPHFTLASDGISGTVLSVNAQTGTFTGTYFNGVVLSNPTTQNPALVTSTAFITNNYGSHNGAGVYGTNAAAWNLTNYGTITTNPTATYAGGVLFQAGGTITNTALISGNSFGVIITGAGLIANSGVITATATSGYSGLGIYLRGGSISNATGGTIYGRITGINISGGVGTVVNDGTIRSGATSGSGGALFLFQGGAVSNSASGLIAGYRTGVSIWGTAGQISNYGTIVNAGTDSAAGYFGGGAAYLGGGVVSNAPTALIAGHAGIDIHLAGTVNNAGTIVSTAPVSGTGAAGVYLGGGGVITNQAGGLITANRAAVSLAFFGSTNADALVTNYGVLSGSTGISIGAGDTGDNTIVNFGTITGTNGIAIRLGGGDDEIVINSYSQLYGAVGNFQPGDTFDLPFLAFSSAETVTRDAGNVLRISQSGVLVYSIQLDPSQNFGINEFGLTNDGAGGTLVVLGPDTTVPVTQQRVLAVNANSGPTPIDIAAPTDPDDPAASLTVTVGSLPSDGTVVLADGVTPVSTGQTLTVNQLTTLQFVPTPNLIGQSSTFTYSVSDPVGNTGFGTAFLGINLPPPPNSPALINGLGGPEGFGENALPPNDDGSSSAIDVTAVFGSGLNFFGNLFTSLYVNNNGNITFTGPLGTFTPEKIDAGFNNPIIAAFWADVDTTGGPGVPTGGNATGSNTVYWDLDTSNHVFTATWDDVGYYNSHNDKLDAFQLRLIDQGGGNFDIEFRYQAIYWTTGDLDDPATEAARAGFSAGDGIHAYELPQSGDQDGMLGLDSNPAPAGTQGVTSEIGVYRFQVRNGVVVPPPPTGLALSPDSDSAPVGDNSTTDTTPTITGFGISGDTVSVFSDGSAVGSGIVQSNGTWAVTLNPLAPGQHSLTATQTDGAGVTSNPSGPLALSIEATLPPPPPPPPLPTLTTRLVDFLFTYDDGKDYYFGTVYDSGNFGYQVGQTITTLAGTTLAGHYDIIGVETSPTAQASGTVRVSTYSHGGIGQASPVPVKTAQGLFDGFNGLGSEVDAILGIEGQEHPFSASSEASFTTVPVWAFVYAYVDGRAFYSGTVADATTEGSVATRTITDTSGNLVGTYSMFRQGSTTFADGTVIVDRVTLDGRAFVPLRSNTGQPNGLAGLGSEQGVIDVNGATVPFSDQVEPRATLTRPTLPLTPPPSPSDVFAAEVNQLYLEILSRGPDPGGLATYTAALANGTSVGGLRVIFARSSEAQSYLNQLYRQIFGRDIDPSGLATYTDTLISGLSLASVQLLLAQSPEAQGGIQQIYQDVLARPADGGGLSTYMATLGNQIEPFSLGDIRNIIAHSAEAASDLSQLVLDVLDRPTFAAELEGMQNELANPGVTQQTLQAELASNGTAGNYALVLDSAGDTGLTGQANTPTLFVFDDVTLGHDVIAGFEPTRDTIQLPTSVAADFATVQSETANTADGSLITFDSNHSILVSGVGSSSLGATNFRFV